MTDPSPYEVLGVSPGATASEIRSAFRNKLRASHPDTTAGGVDDGDVIEVVEAYRRLMARRAASAEKVAAPVEPTVSRRVPVRRAPPPSAESSESPKAGSCPDCQGNGFAETRMICPECRGSGTITRLEAHHARVVVCRRCRGRGEGRARERCPACRGSGIATVAGG